MALGDSVMSLIFYVSYGTNILDHLAADGAGLTGGQVTVVAIGQVDAHFLGSLHLELVHGLTSLRNVDLVVALHIVSLLCPFSGKPPPSVENDFFLSVAIALPKMME